MNELRRRPFAFALRLADDFARACAVRSSSPLVLGVTMATAVACGASSPPPVASTPVESRGEASGTPPGETDPSGRTPPAHGTSEAHAAAMKPPAPTAMAKELEAIGLDVAHLPPLDKLEGDKLRKVMRTFTKALGVRCESCHTDDFAAPTPKKRVAARMWNEYVRGLALAGGEPVYCDSCHQGHEEFLDRRDTKALGAWMNAHYVDGLTRTDGQPHGCETCHGDPFEPHVLALWASGKGPSAPGSKAAPTTAPAPPVPGTPLPRR